MEYEDFEVLVSEDGLKRDSFRNSTTFNFEIKSSHGEDIRLDGEIREAVYGLKAVYVSVFLNEDHHDDAQNIVFSEEEAVDWLRDLAQTLYYDGYAPEAPINYELFYTLTNEGKRL